MEKESVFFKITTPHYEFELQLKERMSHYHTFYFLVGNKAKPCLEGHITLENLSKNDRFSSFEYTANLIKIDALQECSLQDITEEYTEKHSFGKEMIDAILYFINCQFPLIKTISLDDASYIPCIRESSDTLDLLVYYIALHKKTWYEDKMNAYMKPKEKYDAYRAQVDNYGTKETKAQKSWEDIYIRMMRGNNYTIEMLDTHKDKYKDIYEKSETLPEFFVSLNKSIPRKYKCRFFKDWLESFIKEYITIERTWYIDLFPKIEPILKGGRKKRRIYKQRINS